MDPHSLWRIGKSIGILIEERKDRDKEELIILPLLL